MTAAQPALQDITVVSSTHLQQVRRQPSLASAQVEPGVPERLQLSGQPCQLVTVTNSAEAQGRQLLGADASLQLQDGFGNACYVQDVAAHVALLAKDGARTAAWRC